MALSSLAAMTAHPLQALPQRLEAADGFADLLAALSRRRQVEIDGVWGSGCALLAAELARHAPASVVTIVPLQTDMDSFVDDLHLFSRCSTAAFPAWQSDPGERIFHDEVYGDRLRMLKQLLGLQPPKLIVTSIESLLQPCPGRATVASSTRHLQVGELLDLEAFLRWLAEHRFHGATAVELPGEFSARGGIVDIFAADWDQPVRVELFGDEIESIRRFDAATQRSLETLREVEVTVLAPTESAGDFFTSYLPESSWILRVEPQQLEQEGCSYLERQENPALFHGLPRVWRDLQRFGLADLWSLASEAARPLCRLRIESVERFSGEFGKVRDELDRVGEDDEVFVVCDTQAEVERLSEILGPTRLAASGRLHFVIGSLQEGFRLTREHVLVVSGRELFLRAHVRRAPRRHRGKAIDSFMDLRQGDLVVHLAHGIGRYRGLELLDKEGNVEEHLTIEFHGGTRVYVPASKIELVQKYIGGSKSRPNLAKIGGKTWVRQKMAAESAVVDLAVEMIDLQAQRALRPGLAFAPDSEWQREFDASFPYHETEDQLHSLAAIKHDMQSARPMDRLLCGDVGFGKTEVGMRAAFKAVDSGYQVALLAPTTILAEQHYHTFQQRMAEFPFDIGKLSRFCSAKQQRETLEGLKSGRIDIVIGTHRLASRDVAFHNLGLVIIDEEQRFGVEVKDRLKTLRSAVDVLTMSATPIPRTLHMSLVGVRDISNLETPPEDRLAVETRVTRFDAELIHRAVMRELNRGGQIYFVHNRVQDIDALAKKIESIVPEVSLGIAHGQMRESDLEQVMVDFVSHRFDLLLATTIVESGLDIPNANTIFIDEADRYGLADLHQLRGRVGRYKNRAYCYLLIDRHKKVTPNAARRLRAIEEFSEMGAGFAIAMRDLEIHGAGNLLGTQQSGHIAAVGYELYCQLLEDAVRRLKQMPPKLSIDVDIELPGQAYLPDDYVPDIRSKIDLYRRLSRVESFDQLHEFTAELQDRFGELPIEARRLLELAKLKMEAAIWQIGAIHVEDRYVVFTGREPSRLQQLSRSGGGKLRVVDDHHAYLPLTAGDIEVGRVLEVCKSVLQPDR